MLNTISKFKYHLILLYAFNLQCSQREYISSNVEYRRFSNVKLKQAQNSIIIKAVLDLPVQTKIEIKQEFLSSGRVLYAGTITEDMDKDTQTIQHLAENVAYCYYCRLQKYLKK